MHCPSCGTEVRPGQKFCAECGTSLRGVTDITGEIPPIRSEDVPSGSVQDEVTRVMGRVPSPGQVGEEAPTTVFGPPPPSAGFAGAGTTRWSSPGAGPRSARPGEDEPTIVVDPLLSPGAPPRGATTDERTYGRPATSWPTDPNATARLPAQDPWTEPAPTPRAPTTVRPDPTHAYGRPAASGYAPAAVRDHEYVYDSHEPWDEWADEEETGRAFRFRVLFVVAVIAAAATVVGVLSLLIEISPDGGVAAPFDNGTWMVNDFGTNNTVAALLAAGTIVLGAFLWCFGFRWGAGLAGGAGLALAGWVALILGLAEWPIHQAQLAADIVPSTITREFGYWALVGAGGLGVVAFAVSLQGAGRDRQGGLDPWIAALGAVAFLVAAGGPLIPQGSADFSGNYSSETIGVDLPTMFFAGRLVQLGLLAFTGIIGFLLVRRWGLGLAIGGGVAAGFMLATAATEQTDNPIGPGFANPGAVDLAPHGVTIVGMALAGFFALVAVVMAVLDSEP